MTCKECMNGAPYEYCCKIECCYHEVSSPITDNNDKLLNVLKSGGDLKDTIVDWSKARPLEPVVDWSKAKPLPPVTDKTTKKDLIPIERVLDDMYSDTSGVSSAARDYYRMNYATEEEKIEMYREDRIADRFTAIVLIIPVITIITIIIYHLFLN